ncbi:SNF2-related protein [Actinocorallia sp. API 0066]|uniref:DEAD/DEAH box helicase n=1 Tax=Actinocorallia sp. API 0066 TaxID=2896846 RepID=UPI001E57EF9F|nr:DEAD/DEAH box helicase [Actinocorallia sp. API 0066]MCD0448272.1 SNF2-related protein [Actinocorallia sp. API 0066]
MLVGHAVWHGGALCLWAEHDGERAGAAGAHPFATREFGGTVLEAAVRGAARVTLPMLLPSADGGPLPSGELGAAVAAEAPELQVWQVPALVLEPFAAMNVLTAVPALHDRADPGDDAADAGGARGLVAGSDLRFLAIVAGDAVELARRGRVLPALREEDGDLVAHWRAVPDAGRFAALAAAIPPACRAAAPETPAADVLTAALDGLADTAVRARVPHPALPPRTGKTPERIPLAERWFAALTGPSGAVAREPGDDPAPLRADLDAWFRTARPADSPLRLTFRLIDPHATENPTNPAHLPHAADDTIRLPGPEFPTAATVALAHGPARIAGPELADAAPARPEDGGADARGLDQGEAVGEVWRVEFLVQGTRDLSLLVPAGRVWEGDAFVEGAEEVLMAGLGRALRVFPELARALDSAVPSELELDVAGAFRFLRRTAPLLGAAGFGVLLPTWAGRERLGLKLRTADPADGGQQGAAGKSGFGLDDLVEFRWEVAVGDESLDEDELAELARLKTPLVRLRGRWVELDPDQLDAALEFLRHGGSGTMTAGQAVRAVIHAGERSLPLVAVEAHGALGDLLSGEADRRITPVPTPEGITATLRPYQERGLSWLAFMEDLGLGALLADDMGLGKTLTVLSYLVRAVEAGERAPTLAVVPMSLVGTWQREAARFAPKLRVHVHHGQARHRDDALVHAAKAADLVLTTYGTATRDAERLAAVPWARIVCDEAQALKNSATRQAKAIRSIPAPRRIALTGTPVENHLGELWSVMEFANPGVLGPREAFRERFAAPIEGDGDEHAAAALQRATRPFILRRLKTDKSIISDLPEKQEMKVYCPLTPEQASLYRATVEDMLERVAEADARKRRGLVLATMARLKQVCDHPALLLKDGSRLQGRSGKLEHLEELCGRILEAGEKVLVFTQYAEFGTMLQPYLAARLERPVLWLHGGTTREQRDAMVREFQGPSGPSVFLLSLKAAGTGLTLTAANHVIHLDRWWNPAVEDQATDRAFRIGQTRDVQVRKFVCAGTMEERVDEMIERKKALAEAVVGTGEEWLTGLSVAELRDLLALSPDAVAR